MKTLDAQPAPDRMARAGTGPCLILLPPRQPSSPDASAPRRILGLDLVSRLSLAASRAGYGPVCRLAPTQGASPEVETVAGWEPLALRLQNDSNPCAIAST